MEFLSGITLYISRRNVLRHLDCFLEWALLLGPYVICVGQEEDSTLSPPLSVAASMHKIQPPLQ